MTNAIDHSDLDIDGDGGMQLLWLQSEKCGIQDRGQWGFIGRAPALMPTDDDLLSSVPLRAVGALLLPPVGGARWE